MTRAFRHWALSTLAVLALAGCSASNERLAQRLEGGWAAVSRGEYAEGAALLEQVLEEDPENLYALTHLGLAYQQLGRLEEALQALGAADRLDPSRSSADAAYLDYYFGLAYESLERPEEALRSYERFATLRPEDPLGHARLGVLYEAAGRLEEARWHYDRAVSLDRSDAASLAGSDRMVQKILDAGGDPFPNAVPAVRVLDASAAEERLRGAWDLDESYSGADAVVLFSRYEHEILADGRARFTTHFAAKLQSWRAVADYGEAAVPYNASSQNIRVNRALTRFEDGSMLRVGEDAIRDATPRAALAFNLYSDTLWKVVSFSGLAPGVVVEYQVTVEDANARGGTDDVWFWNDAALQSKHPSLGTEYGLRVPEEVDFRWKTYRAEVSLEERREDGFAVYIWRSGASGPFRAEAGAPAAELTPRLALSSADSWEQIHGWYRRLLQDRGEVDEAFALAAGAAAAAGETQEERIAALCAFASRELRYVAIQLGAGAYQPRAASETFRRRYGDCKDMTNALIAALSLIGVEAYPALLNPTDGGADVDIELPSLGQFSHMILAVPDGSGGYVWYDPTEDALPYGRLPARDQGRLALILAPGGPEWARTPVDRAEANRFDWELEGAFSADGSFEGLERLRATGLRAAELRRLYGGVNPSELGSALSGLMSASYPGLELLDWRVSGLEEPALPVEVAVRFSVPGYARSLGGGYWLAPIPGGGLASRAELTHAAERLSPFALGVPTAATRRVRYRLPWPAAPLDPPAALESRYASFRRAYGVEDGAAAYDLEFSILEPSAPAEALPELKTLFGSLAREEGASFLCREALP